MYREISFVPISLKDGLYPMNGMLRLSKKPGLGLELNEEIITSKQFLEF